MPTEGVDSGHTPRGPRGSGQRRLHRIFATYVLACAGVLALMLVLERAGLSRGWIATIFLLVPVFVFAIVGTLCRTTNVDEYYVAGRIVPAPYNGIAIAADWMSVASFLGLTGLLYATGYSGLAYLVGWTGGFCLVAMYVAPFLRKSGLYTIPDFLGHRYGSHLPRMVGLWICVLCSFVYVVAQIYGVGLIVSRLTGRSLEIGVFLGLGGVLVCSFLGGMWAVTWTQAAQYVILLMAFVVPVVWLSVRQTGVPLPQVAAAMQVPKLATREAELRDDPGERLAGAAFAADARVHAGKLERLEEARAEDLDEALRRKQRALAGGGRSEELRAANRALSAIPKDNEAARKAWTRTRDDSLRRSQPLAGMPSFAQADPEEDLRGGATPPSAEKNSKLNFIALIVCLMAGTAGMPHVLMRFYTTPTVRAARWSVVWALGAIAVLYICAPILAILLRWEVLHGVVGLPLDQLPQWVADWSRLDPTLVSVRDINGDGLLQSAEIKISPDILVLATPEIGGMPYVITCLVAAGGLSAALSTADGLLLTIANALTHDLFFSGSPALHASKRVAISKVVLLAVAVLAAYVATLQLAEILTWVTAAFSIAAATIFPALVLGVYWKRTERWGATAGMLTGLAVTLGYLIHAHPAVREIRGLPTEGGLWWGIQPNAAGVFGIPVAFVVTFVVSFVVGGGLQRSTIVDDLRRPGAS